MNAQDERTSSAPDGEATPKRKQALAHRRTLWPSATTKTLTRVDSVLGDGKVIDYIGHNRSRKQATSDRAADALKDAA